MCKNNDEEVLILNILCVRWGGGVIYSHTLILRNMLHIKLTFVNDKSHTCTFENCQIRWFHYCHS